MPAYHQFQKHLYFCSSSFGHLDLLLCGARFPISNQTNAFVNLVELVSLRKETNVDVGSQKTVKHSTTSKQNIYKIIPIMSD